MNASPHILFPIGRNLQDLQKVVRFAEQCGGQLLLLFTYRLTDSNITRQLGSKKRVIAGMANGIRSELETLFADVLGSTQAAPELLVEVGFLSDRIAAAIADRPVDIVVLGSDTLLEKDEIQQLKALSHVRVLTVAELEEASLVS